MTEEQIDAKARNAVECIRRYELSGAMRLAVRGRLPIYDRYSAAARVVELCTGKWEPTIVLDAIVGLWEQQD